MTPEGKIKAKVKRLLNAYRWVYYEMPVPTGYGKSGLDFSCSVAGLALYIETKAPGEWLTSRQCETAMKQYLSGATVLIISGPGGLTALEKFLHKHAMLKEVE